MAERVEPYAWLENVFRTSPNCRDSEAFQQSQKNGLVVSTELDQLLPNRWLEAHPKHRWMIDEIRGAERRQKESAKRARRRERGKHKD